MHMACMGITGDGKGELGIMVGEEVGVQENCPWKYSMVLQEVLWV